MSAEERKEWKREKRDQLNQHDLYCADAGAITNGSSLPGAG